MRTYILKRLLLIVPTLLGAAALVFLIMRVIPGDVALLIFGGDQAGHIDPKQLAAMRHRLGLDQPLIVQFGTWLWGVLRFDFGNSLWTWWRGRETEPHRAALAERVGERVLDRAEEVSRHALARDRVGRGQVEAVVGPARAQRRDPGGEVPLTHPAADRLADPGPDSRRVLSPSRARRRFHCSSATSTPVETRDTGPCAQALPAPAALASPPSRAPSTPSPRPGPPRA